MTLSIRLSNTRQFAAVSLFVSTEAARTYIQGVYIEPVASGGVSLTATDGHNLLTVHDADGVADRPALIAPPKIPAKAINADSPLSFDGETCRDDNGAIIGVAGEIDGQFPDWRRALPADDTDTWVVTFNPDYLARFKKAAAILTSNRNAFIRWTPNGNNPAWVSLGVDTARGVIMPARSDKVPNHIGRPHWAKS